MAIFMDVQPNDIVDIDGTEYLAERWSRHALIATSTLDNVGWKIKRNLHHPVTITGKKTLVRAQLNPGELFIWKGKKGEAMLFECVLQFSSSIEAKNPIDGKIWVLQGSASAYAKFEDVMNKKVQL